MVRVADHRKLALRHEPVRLPRHRGIDEGVLVALDDQCRPAPPAHDGPERTLIGIGEVAGVLNRKHAVVPGPKVRDGIEEDPEGRLLQPMDGMVEMVVAEEFVLLRADGRKEHDRGDPVRPLLGQVERHAAAHAETDDVDSRKAEGVHQCRNVGRMGLDRIDGDPPGRSPESWKVGGDGPTGRGKGSRKAGDLAVVTGASVEQDDRRGLGRVWRAFVAVGQAQGRSRGSNRDGHRPLIWREAAGGRPPGPNRGRRGEGGQVGAEDPGKRSDPPTHRVGSDPAAAIRRVMTRSVTQGGPGR